MGRRERGKRTTWVLTALVATATIVAYSGTLGNDFVNYDDNLYVTGNRQVRQGLTLEGVAWAFSTTDTGNWHPLTWLSHMTDVQLFGLDPRGHHAVSLLLHLTNSLILFLVLQAMTGASWRSLAVAVFFSVHPLHVESVAWVAERKDVLGAFFWMVCMGLYARYARRPSRGRYAMLAAAFAVGLMTKPMLVTLPFALLLLDFWPLQRTGTGQAGAGESPFARASYLRLLGEKTPLLFLSAASSVVTFLAQQQEGAITRFGQLGAADRFANALVSYVAYILKMVVPADLAFFYPYPASGHPPWKPIVAAVLLAAVSAMVLLAGRRRGYLVTGWLWYLGTLLPVIGIVQVGAQSMADRYTYLPSIGVFLAVTWGISDLAGERRVPRSVLAASSVAVICLLAAVTRTQVGYWKNSVTLFRHAVDVTDDNYVAHDALGIALAGEGDLAGAIAQFTEAVKSRPNDPESLTDLGLALAGTGRTGEAKRAYERAIASRPGFSRAHYNLAVLLQKGGKLQAAAEEYATVLSTEPDHADAHNNLGVALQQLGRREEALLHFRRAIEIDPRHEGAARNLRAALLR